ncbi:MAG TPA: hypothetical protein VGC65_11905 [Bacteroidia bacterium]
MKKKIGYFLLLCSVFMCAALSAHQSSIDSLKRDDILIMGVRIV